MKKILAFAIMAISLSSNAFWGNNNWNNGYDNNYYNNNGIFGYNSYDFWDPRWYMEEMSDLFDEFDNDWSNNGYGNYPYNHQNMHNGSYMKTPYGPGRVPAKTVVK
jgi:hypothetical protein